MSQTKSLKPRTFLGLLFIACFASIFSLKLLGRVSGVPVDPWLLVAKAFGAAIVPWGIAAFTIRNIKKRPVERHKALYIWATCTALLLILFGMLGERSEALEKEKLSGAATSFSEQDNILLGR